MLWARCHNVGMKIVLAKNKNESTDDLLPNVLFYGQNDSRVLYIAFRKFALKAFDSVIPGTQSVQAPFLTQHAIFMNSE